MARVTLDRETFKALASETRLDLLHGLDERRKTGTELARELELNKATVHEHLQVLSAVGLVRKVDEGRKWIYYELTWEGRKLLHPESGATFSVLLVLSILSAGSAFAMLGRALGWWLDRNAMTTGEPEGGADLAAPADDDGTQYDKAPASSTTASPSPEPSNPPQSGYDSSLASNGTGDSESLLLADNDSSGGPDFFDDGGWTVIALVAAALLFVYLAFLLRRSRPGVPPEDPDDTANAES